MKWICSNCKHSFVDRHGCHRGNDACLKASGDGCARGRKVAWLSLVWGGRAGGNFGNGKDEGCNICSTLDMFFKSTSSSWREKKSGSPNQWYGDCSFRSRSQQLVGIEPWSLRLSPVDLRALKKTTWMPDVRCRTWNKVFLLRILGIKYTQFHATVLRAKIQ